MIDGDHHQLCQVFTNLLTNAFEALDGRGHIMISAVAEVQMMDPAFASDPHAPMPAIIVDVTDDGPGVPQDLSDRIFDPFFTTKPQGSGLGLPIVRKIVDAHDGRDVELGAAALGARRGEREPVVDLAAGDGRVGGPLRPAVRHAGAVVAEARARVVGGDARGHATARRHE